ncbi:MAG: heavy metal-associated domain-containing protein, partial [Candidatus Thermoplasmatota archaeon]|nr:heavy metal-associated domain-containing protein [Candidatus Thermoplasmatota archaeon]
MTESLEFQINGMTCGGCSGRVKGVLEMNLNVESAEISHETNSGVVKTNGQISAEELVKIIEQTGFTAA